MGAVKSANMSLEDIEALPKNTLTPADVAGYLGMNPYNINCACKAGTVPWAFQVKSRTVISKSAFVHWMRYGAVVKDVGYHPELDGRINTRS